MLTFWESPFASSFLFKKYIYLYLSTCIYTKEIKEKNMIGFFFEKYHLEIEQTLFCLILESHAIYQKNIYSQ